MRRFVWLGTCVAFGRGLAAGPLEDEAIALDEAHDDLLTSRTSPIRSPRE